MDKLLSLEQLKILKLRNPRFTVKQEKTLKQLQSGYLGESGFLAFIQRFGHSNWGVFHDYWFDDGKRMQADFVLITPKRWIVVEVKHYDGLFEFKNGECYLNNRLMSDNYFASMDLRVKKIRHIAHQLNRDIHVEGLLTFNHQYSEAHIDLDRDYDFEVLLRHQLKSYVLNLKATDGHILDQAYIRRIEKALEVYRVESPFLPKSINNTDWHNLKKGIYCINCHNFNMKINYKHISCEVCKTTEFKYAAITRMYEELCLLYYGNEKLVTPQKIYEYCDKQLSKASIYRSMKIMRK